MKRGAIRFFGRGLAASGAALAMTSAALAGGSAENILLIINPGSAESMYLGNYYKNARNIPDRNVLYIDPSAPDYAAFTGANGNQDGFLGYLANAKLSDHIDYIVLASTGSFFVSAPGYITDSCWPVARFSQSSVFTMAFIKNTILPGNLPSTTTNQYFSQDPAQPRAFSSAITWLGGSPTALPNTPRYFISAQLGYTGANGNTLNEILTMIDRDVAADNTRPAGSFYYMNNIADPIRNIRACGSFSGCAGPTPIYTNAVNALIARGASAQVMAGMLPTGMQNCLGIMTGNATLPIETEVMTLLPGAFCDHLTSWAATFDNGSQTTVASWIRKGAAASSGEVEEPCAYPGKFPAPNMHVHYFQGLSLGEAWLRSLNYVPFQHLLYGDPMTRPFATLPSVNATVPAGPVGGRVSFTPSASTTLSGAAIANLDLLIDGVFQSRITPGQQFSINTLPLADGWHELRILAYDNTLVKNTGRWIGTLNVNNFGRAATLGVLPPSGDMTTLFTASAGGSGGTITAARLLHNGRVVAASTSLPAALQVYGRNLGSGLSRVQLEVEFADGLLARSAPVNLDIAYTVGAFSNLPPVAYSYTKRVARGSSSVIELPAKFDDGLANTTYTIVTPPGQGTTVGPDAKGYRIMTTTASACGTDQFTFRVNTPSGQSNTATVKLIYGAGPVCPVDMDGDGLATVNDFIFFQNTYATGSLRADVDGSCLLNINDFVTFLNLYAIGCP